MKPPHVPEDPPDVLSEAELERSLKTCRGKDSEARRDLAIIMLSADTGMRRSELAEPERDAPDHHETRCSSLWSRTSETDSMTVLRTTAGDPGGIVSLSLTGTRSANS